MPEEIQEIMPMENDAQTMRDVMRELGKSETLSDPMLAGKPITEPWVITTPTGREHHNLTDIRLAAAQFFKPFRRTGTAKMHDLASLIAWAKRFKGETSALFANPSQTNPRLQCVADYHGSGPASFDGVTGDDKASHCDHRASYEFPLSKEWKTWAAASGKPMDKDEMGEFLEANAKDIQDPTPNILKMAHNAADVEPWEQRLINTALQIEGRYGQLAQLLALSRSFQVFESSNLEVTSNRDTGEQSIQFTNEHKDKEGAPIKIPNLVIITIPVFENGALYRLPVRMRYRKKGSNLAFILTTYNPQAAFDDAFKGAVKQAADETKMPTFMGSPES